MDLLLSGTGPAAGFPVPSCTCAACHTATPAGPYLFRRPAELLLGDRYRLEVDGSLHDGRGTTHRLFGDEELDLPGIRVWAVPVPDGSSCLLIIPDDDPPLLWAPQAGELPGPAVTALAAALAGSVLGTAVLGTAPDPDPTAPDDAPSPARAARSLARLRATGAVDSSTSCVLVGLGHRQGPADRLALCLRYWRAQAPPDGTRLSPLSAPPDPGNGRTLVLGGSGSGKSGLAEDLLAAEPEVVYTATGPVVDLRTSPDEEWARRVRVHRERRPAWWRTEETHLVAHLLATVDQPVLLDSVGTWLTGGLDRAGAWDDRPGWRERVAAESAELVRAWRARTGPLVAVSDEVGLGVVPATAAGRLFRDELGRLNRQLADESEHTHVVLAGRLLTPW